MRARGPVVAALLVGMLVLAALAVRRLGTRPAATPPGNGTAPPVAAGDDASTDRPVRGRVDVADDAPRVDAAAPDAADGAIVVVGPDGEPAGATILTTPEATWPGRDDAARLGTTGDDGRLSSADRKTAPLAFVWAVAPGLIAGPEPFEPGGQELTLGPGCSVEVTVTRPDGSPIAGAVCHGEPRSNTGVTDATGRCTLTGFAAGYVPVIVVQVWGARMTAGRASTTSPSAPSQATIVVDPGEGPFVAIELATPGAPRDDVRIEVVGLRLAGRLGVATDDPPFLLSLHRATGPVTLEARAAGMRVASTKLEGLAPGTTTRVTLTLEPGQAPRRGRVLNADGSPAPGVRVGAPGHGHGSTDEDGWFDVRAGWLGREIRAVDEAHACSPSVALVADLPELVLRLEKGATIEGVVRDTTSGRPVEGATVGIWLDAGGYPDWTVTTDSEGRYAASGLWDGAFVAAEHVPSSRATDTAEATARWKSLAGATEEEWIRRGAGHRVSGTQTIRHDLAVMAQAGSEVVLRLRYPDGVPPPEEIHVERASSASGTLGWEFEYEGEFARNAEPRIFLHPGAHRLRVTAPGLIGETQPVRLRAGDPSRTLDIEVQRRKQVRIRVVDAEGSPIERAGIDVTLWIRGPGDALDLVNVATDHRGVADPTDEFPSGHRLESNLVRVEIELGGAGYAGGGNRVLSAGECRRGLDGLSGTPWIIDVPVRQAPGLTVHVVDAEGRPAVGVPVRWWSDTSSDIGGEAVSDARGALHLRRPGDWFDVTILATGEWIGRNTVSTADIETGDPTIVVDRRRTVRVHVVGEDGAAVDHRGARWSGPDEGDAAHTDAEGRLDVELPASEVRVHIAVDGHVPRHDVLVPAGDLDIAVTLERTRSITLRVEPPPQLRRPGSVDVELGDEETGRWTDWVSIAKSGPWIGRLAVPRRPVDLHVDLGDPRLDGRARYDGSGDSVTVRVQPAPLVDASLSFVDDDGAPLAGQVVTLRAERDFRILDEKVETDASGRATVRVPEGCRTSIDVEMDGFRDTTFILDTTTPPVTPIEVHLRRRR